MAVIFSRTGITTFTALRDPAIDGYKTVRQFRNPMVSSAGGKVFVYHKDVTFDAVALTWKYMEPTDLTNCLTFLRAVNFSALNFDFTDPAGDHFLAQYIGPEKLAWTPTDLSERDFTVQLLILTQLRHLTNESGAYITDESGNRILAQIAL
jgi:hypothetical protein